MRYSIANVDCPHPDKLEYQQNEQQGRHVADGNVPLEAARDTLL